MVSPLVQLAGVWRGTGAGQFPTMDAFEYHEEVRFIDLGVPALIYQQRAWSTDGGELLHFETGIWRADGDGTVAITVALPRVSEISEGRFDDGRLDLTSTSVRRASGGAGLVAVQRTYDVQRDEIRYRIGMATEAVNQVSHHLEGTLRRTPVSRA